jgi:hypothetical protein
MLTSSEVQRRGEPIEPAMGQCGGGGRCAVRAVLGARTRGEWGGDECGEVGVSSSPFYRASGWSGGGRMGKGIGRPVVAASMPGVFFGGEGKRRGEWGVKRGQNAAPFLGEEGSSGRQQRTQEVAAAALGRASRGRRRSAD